MNGGQSSFWVEEHHGTNDDDDFNFTPFCPTPKRRPSKKMKMEFTGWGSTPLIRFLQSLGQDTTNKISQFDVSSIINNYVNANRLLHPTKKKRIVCDTNLFTLFGKKTIARIKVYDLLEPHFAENRVGSSSDDLGLGDDDDLLNFSDDENKENGNHKKEAPPKTEAPPKKRKGFAAIIPENIRLLYLKKSLIEELLLKDQLPTLEAKMVGSFVRIKNDPHDYLQKSSHQLLQVTGVKEITENDNSSPKVVFQVSNYFKDIPISIISDDDFTEKECESLHQKVKDGLLKKPTIVEFEEKVQALHEDITKHWLVREIDLLQKLINRANEKGWRKELFEFMERRQLLQKPEEQSRLLREVPIVLAEEVKKVEPELLNLPDVEQQGSGDSPAPILRGASETPTSNKKANNSQFWIPCVPNIAASTPSTFIRRLQEDEKQGKVGLSVSVPEVASGIPICDDVAKGNSSRVSAMEVSAGIIKGKKRAKLLAEIQQLSKKLQSTNKVCVLPSIRIRTTPSQLANVMTALTSAQQECVRNIGFGSLLGFNIDKLPGRLVYYVVDNFDSTDMVIRTTKGDIKCDHDAVYDVFGIPKGGVDIFSLEFKIDCDFISEWLGQFSSGKDIRPSHIAAKILDSNGATDHLFKMNILMLFANTMAASDSNGLCKFDILNYVSKDADIPSLDWCGFLLKSLEFSKNQWHRDDVNKRFYAGPATFLTLLYVDRTKFDDMPVSRQRPIFKHWNGVLTIRGNKEAALGSFGLLELMPPYEQEKDEEEEDFFVADDSNEEYCKLIEEKFDEVLKIKKLLFRTFKEGFTKFPNDCILRTKYKKMGNIFSLNDGLDKDEEDDKRKVEEVVMGLNKDDKDEEVVDIDSQEDINLDSDEVAGGVRKVIKWAMGYGEKKHSDDYKQVDDDDDDDDDVEKKQSDDDDGGDDDDDCRYPIPIGKEVFINKYLRFGID